MLHVADTNGRFLRLQRDFSFMTWNDIVQVSLVAPDPRSTDADDLHVWPLGSVKRNFAFFYRQFTLFDRAHNPVFEISGNPIWSPWTFTVKRVGRAVAGRKGEQHAIEASVDSGKLIGHIKKKWDGLMQELFTDADTFGLE